MIRPLTFQEIEGPSRGQKEYSFTFGISGVGTKGEKIIVRLNDQLTVRRGDEIAGNKVGEFINREPQWLPTDGYERGTLPTLELISIKTGQKHIIEFGYSPLWNFPLEEPILVRGSYASEGASQRARIGEMLMTFVGTQEIVNSQTKERESIVHLRFEDLPILEQPLAFRPGDTVAGYLIGEMKNPAAATTLEITHIASKTKFVLEKQKPQIVYR